MKCDRCGVENSNDSFFCMQCGNPLNNNINNIENTAPLRNSSSVKNDKFLVVIISLGLVAFLIIGILMYFSLTTIKKNNNVIDTGYYQSIIGKWGDAYNNNLLNIKNNGSYEWYQDYSSNINDKIQGEVEVLIGEGALNELNLNLDIIMQMFNVADISEDDIYYAKLYTSKTNIKYAYYKILIVTRDNELLVYNFNDKATYFFEDKDN